MRGQRSVVWLKRGQPCLHHLHVLSTVLSINMRQLIGVRAIRVLLLKISNNSYLDFQVVRCCIQRYYHATISATLVDRDPASKNNSLVDGVHVILLQRNVLIRGSSEK